MSTTKVVLLSVGATIVAFALVGVGIVLGTKYFANTALPNNINTLSSVVATPISTTMATSSPASLPSTITGQIKLLDRDLGLLKDDPALGRNHGVTYYEAGTFAEGAYKDYKRIVAVVPPMEMGSVQFYTFATKDYSSFVFDGDPRDAIDFSADSYQNPYSYLDKQKISAIDTLPTFHPEMIALNTTFALLKDEFTSYHEYKPNLQYPESFDSQPKLVTDFSHHQELSSQGAPFKLYAGKSAAEFPNYPASLIQADLPRPANLAGIASVNVVDASGLAYNYRIVFKKDAEQYLRAKPQYDKETRAYLIALEPPNLALNPSPIHPESLLMPALHLEQQDLEGIPEALYASYGPAFFHGHGFYAGDAGLAKGVPVADLQKLGEVHGVEVYKLTNASNPLLAYFYEQKIGAVDGSYSRMGNVETKPSFAEYVHTQGIIFLKDPWDRLMILQEDIYDVPLEVGKPVIYLYPTKNTEVSVTLNTPIKFSTTIPSYHHGWKVLADPHGNLTDLQPQFTDCAAIDTAHIGSEYAIQACKQNTYPYIYWAGRPLGTDYPTIDRGWVVARTEVESFMHETLDHVGLTAPEKGDMLEYWLPRMLAKEAPFYRISFLQTAAMDQIAPMTITPAPDNIFRIFLDFEPLQKKIEIPAQNLTKIVRKGFTVVEWGGLKE